MAMTKAEKETVRLIETLLNLSSDASSKSTVKDDYAAGVAKGYMLAAKHVTFLLNAGFMS